MVSSFSSNISIWFSVWTYDSDDLFALHEGVGEYYERRYALQFVRWQTISRSITFAVIFLPHINSYVYNFRALATSTATATTTADSMLISTYVNWLTTLLAYTNWNGAKKTMFKKIKQKNKRKKRKTKLNCKNLYSRDSWSLERKKEAKCVSRVKNYVRLNTLHISHSAQLIIDCVFSCLLRPSWCLEFVFVITSTNFVGMWEIIVYNQYCSCSYIYIVSYAKSMV